MLRLQTATAESQHPHVHISMNCGLKAQDSRYNEESLRWSACSGVIRPTSTCLHWIIVGLTNEFARLTLGFDTVSDWPFMEPFGSMREIIPVPLTIIQNAMTKIDWAKCIASL